MKYNGIVGFQVGDDLLEYSPIINKSLNKIQLELIKIHAVSNDICILDLLKDMYESANFDGKSAFQK